MRDQECVDLLQWMLPILHLRWAGFRRVRKQVCKRVSRRLRQLGLPSAAGYRRYLESNPAEWAVAESLLRVTISRFFRDRGMFAFLASDILPVLASRALQTDRSSMLAWSAGCASGEEPYSLALLWAFRLAAGQPNLVMRILATDADQHLLTRARAARYPPGCLKDLPEAWRSTAFDRIDDDFRLKQSFQGDIQFQLHDLRADPPDGPFDLVLCRNLAFTYFDHDLQVTTAHKLQAVLRDGGALVLGSHEQLPVEVRELPVWSAHHRIYQKRVTQG